MLLRMSVNGQRSIANPKHHLKLYLRPHLVDDMTAGQIANFMWISNCDIKAGSRCLFNTDARLRLSSWILYSLGLALGVESLPRVDRTSVIVT